MWAWAWFLPAVYRSETVILVEQQKVPEQYVVPNVSADLQDQLQNMTQQILGRMRLLEVIKNFNLYPALRARVTDDEMVERMRKDIQVELVQAANRTGNLRLQGFLHVARPGAGSEGHGPTYLDHR